MNLKAARKKYRIHQSELAKQLGVDQSMISHFESGRAALTHERILEIQSAFIAILRERIRVQSEQLKTLERS